MFQGNALSVLLLFGFLGSCDAHGLLLEPHARGAGEGLTTWGGSYWYSQSCTIGCSSCNVTTDVPASQYAGDLCPEDHSGDKNPTINAPHLRSAMGNGCRDPITKKPAPCTPDNEDSDWTKFHPWRAPGRAPMYDPCGVAGASSSNNSQLAGGFGYITGYPQGFPGSSLPSLAGDKPLWTSGSTVEVAWAAVANHGGGYQYALCPAGEEASEECFHKHPLSFASDKQVLRYMYINNTANQTEVTIDAVRVSEGTVPKGSTWTKHPVPTGVNVAEWQPGRNGRVPQFVPPAGCDDSCWGYQPCNVGFTHPSFEGWDDTNRRPNEYFPEPGTEVPADFPACTVDGKDGTGCCHTTAYMAVVDQVVVPELPVGDYVLRWRWDAELTPQIWANCADVKIC